MAAEQARVIVTKECNLDIEWEMQAYLIDCEARNLSPTTIVSYRGELRHLRDYLAEQGVTMIPEITPRILRSWLLKLAETRSPGGVHVNYRVTKSFLRWVWAEIELEARNPIARVQAPKVPKKVLPPVNLGDLRAMLRTCDRSHFVGARDEAMFLSLLDTGCRASEFVALDIGDVDIGTGQVDVRHGKGAKSRVTFLGKRSRQAVKRYLRFRQEIDEHEPLWVTSQGTRFRYEGLRQALRRRAEMAEVDPPTLHSFRRGFALVSLRNGADVYSLQRLMGHADLTMLRRYLAQTDEDLQEAHRRSGPVDNLF